MRGARNRIKRPTITVEVCSVCEGKEWYCTKVFRGCDAGIEGGSYCYKECDFHERCDNCQPDFGCWGD